MRNLLELAFHLIVTLLTLRKPGGAKALLAENMAMRRQLLVVSRQKRRASKLTTSDRFIFGLLAGLISPYRLRKIAVLVKPATIVEFYRALVQKKYRRLYSGKSNKQPGRRGPTQDMIDLVLAIKQKNPRYGYRRIAGQIYQSFGVPISYFAVGRILRKRYKPKYGGHHSGPSWLSFFGHMKDSLWSVDFFKCESIALKTHTVMVVMDQFSRRIIGFAVYAGDPCGADICRLFDAIKVGQKELPKYLSSDNDPLFQCHR